MVGKTANKLFGIKSKIVKQENWWHIYLPCPYHLTHKKYHPITEWYHRLGLKRVHSWEKEIPAAIFSLDNERLSLFFKHLWATDGHIGYRQCKKNGKNIGNEVGTMYYASTSEKLAQAVKHLLLNFGIRSKIREAKKGNYRICYQVHIEGTAHQMIFLKKIGCFGERGRLIPKIIEKLEKIRVNTNLDTWPKETWQFIISPIREEQDLSWRDFSVGIKTQYCGSALFKCGISATRMKKIANFLQSPILANMAVSNIFWDEILSIKALGVQEVFDATVPKTHNFTANGIVAHNSIEQDADVVMFIYREDRYKQTSDRKNIADIIVAKHRNGPVGKVELYFDETRASFRNLDKHYSSDTY